MHEEKESAQTSTLSIYTTIDEYSLRLKVSNRTVKSWIVRGLPSISVGRVRRIITEQADAWLAAGGAEQRTEKKTSKRAKRATG